jgi:hypothetical protein
MNVSDLPLPALLVEMIEARRWKAPRNLNRLAEIAGFKKARKLDFMKPEQMQRETDALIALYEQGFAEKYGLLLSEEGKTAPDDPTRVDVRLVVVIANNWDEEGICLDYRPGLAKPRVMAGMWPDDEDALMHWRVIARDFPEFVELAGF